MSSTDQNSQHSREKVLQNALKSSAGTVLSRILGLVRDILCAAIFSTHVADAWAAAFRLPNLMRRLLGEGALSVSFVPTFLKIQNESGLKSQTTKQFVNGFYTLFLVWVGVLSVLAGLFAEPLMKMILDQQYVENREAFILTVDLFRIMVGFFFFLSLYAYWMGILNAFGQFGRASLAPAITNGVMILLMILPQSWFKVDGYQLGLGVLFGGILQSLFLIPALQRIQCLPHFQWPSRDVLKNILKVFRNMIPAVLAVGLLHFMNLINLKWSSSEGSGAISAFYYADRILELPLSLISVSLGSALLPQLTNLWNQKKRSEFSQSFSHFMKMNLIVAIPAAIGLWVLANPIVQFLFERGEFQAEQTQLTYPLIQYSAGVLLIYSMIRILSSALFAMQKHNLVAILSVFSLIVHWMFSDYFLNLYGLRGLLISIFFSSLMSLVGLIYFYFKFLGSFDFQFSIKEYGKILCANCVVYMVCISHTLFPHIIFTILSSIVIYAFLIHKMCLKLKL